MNEQWELINAQVQALSQRERLLIIVSLLAMIWKAFDVLVFSVVIDQNELYRREIISKQEEVTKLAQQEVELIKAANADPSAEGKKKLAEMKQRIAQMDTDIQVMGRDLVKPESMPYVLESILQQNPQLRLVSLKTLPVSGLLDANSPNKDKNSPLMGIYKHGFQLTIEGGYFDLLHYVTSLEVSPWRTLWGEFGLTAGTYPKSTLTLTLYTLSLDKKWLTL